MRRFYARAVDFCGFVKQLPGTKCPQAALSTAIELFFEMYAPCCRGYLHTLAGACPLKNICALRHAPQKVRSVLTY